MAIPNFTEWMKVKESTAFTRERAAAANGTGHSIPDAEINSHDTARPSVRDAILKRNKKDKKKDDDCDD